MPIKITPIEITNEEIGAVKQKTPDKLPDRPTDAGWGAARIKAFLTGVLVDDNASLLALLRLVVNRANEKLNSIIEQVDHADEATAKSLSDLAEELEEFKASMDRSEEDLNDTIKSLIDEEIYPWARAEQKPSYNCDEVGAMPANTFIPGKTSDIENDGNGQSAFSTVEELSYELITHGADSNAHGDIRDKLREISERLTAVLDSDDDTLDELSEIVAYIKDNKELIDAITINKVSVSDVIDDLTSDIKNKPLSAAQGVVLAGLIAKLSTRFDEFIYAGGEADPTVPDWAKEDTKPTYTPEEIGALPSSHATDEESHSDIRLKLEELSARIAAVLDSDDDTLDELSEIVAYIKDNKELIDAITINKVNISDIVDNLLTSAADKPLSAAQGVILKALIDESLFSKHFGTTAGTVCQGNDSRLSDSRTPKSHASSSSTYGLASSSKYGHAKASATTPKANGSAKVGSETSAFARGDHVHPHDYPIGFPFISPDSTSPTDRGIAGTWEEIPEGHTIVGAGSTYEVGVPGGSADAVVISHTHNFVGTGGDWGNFDGSALYRGGSNSYANPSLTHGSYGSDSGYVSIKRTGEDGTGKNMMPYVAYYAWIRIA